MDREPNRLSFRIPWLLEAAAHGNLAVSVVSVLVVIVVGVAFFKV